MRHPFDGIEGLDRRGFLAGLLAVGAGLAVSQMASAAAPPPLKQGSTEALHEEGGHLTTLMLGEEGGRPTKARGEDGLLTEKVGEDGLTTKTVHEEGKHLSTAALGEEGGDFTTQAANEEGGKKRR